MNYNKIKVSIGQPEYDIAFWNEIKGKPDSNGKLTGEHIVNAGGYLLPSSSDDMYEKEIKRESIFRNLASVFNDYKEKSDIVAFYSDDIAEYVPEFGAIDTTSAADDFTKIPVSRKKLALMVKDSIETVTNPAFNYEKYLIKRMAKSFGKAEDLSFVTGDGENEPTGILHDTKGAETGVTTEGITYDKIVELFFSLDKDYRKNAVWLMNDKTAMALRKMKDGSGLPIWNTEKDTIFGKPVVICNDMPDADDGEKPIAFGDFSYYWIVKRSPLSVTVLKERFIDEGKIAYLAFEFLDAKLIHRDAVKVLKVESEE